MRILRALQGGLESMYRVETHLDVCDFLIARTEGRSSKEQLLVRQSADEMEIGLFVADDTLENLNERDPGQRLDEQNLQDFLLVVEGVSHFVYLAHRAAAERPVSAVEMELQAEVDKYLVALLLLWAQSGGPPAKGELRNRLFERVEFAPDLSSEERGRYHLANSAASSYTASLEKRYVRHRAIDDMLAEARRFYRKGLAGKLAEVALLAA